MENKKAKSNKSHIAAHTREFSIYSGAGIQMAVSIVVFIMLGWWGDKELGTTPWLLLVGIFFALASLVVILIKLIKTTGFLKDEDK